VDAQLTTRSAGQGTSRAHDAHECSFAIFQLPLLGNNQRLENSLRRPSGELLYRSYRYLSTNREPFGLAILFLDATITENNISDIIKIYIHGRFIT
jgi:hypothetical protein